jgi:tRNA1(Val) A37 N6-methylase TrmN6
MPETETLTADRFLGGRLEILQPEHGYRAGIDPVLLAAAVPARAGEHVLDLGCGVGTVLACLAARVEGVVLTGLEIQPAYADLARRNAKANGLSFEVVEGDVAAMPAGLRAQTFDHVVMNPPYWDGAARTPSADPGREMALAGTEAEALWCDAALRRLKPGGVLTMIHPPQTLPKVLAALSGRAALTIRPLQPREGRDASRIVLHARKGGRAPCVLNAPEVLHQGAEHRDGDAYTPKFRAILRDGAGWDQRGH